MNRVDLVGRVANDPIVRYSATNSLAVARFAVAISRGKDSSGNDRGADYPGCIAFGKTAEVIEKYVKKGHRVGVEGHLQTGSYEKDGKKIYTTDVVVDRLEFLETKENAANRSASAAKSQQSSAEIPAFPDPVPTAPDGFENLDDDMPF